MAIIKGKAPSAANTEGLKYKYTKNNIHCTHARTHVKAFIVWLACHELIPAALAVWLIRKAGLVHD